MQDKVAFHHSPEPSTRYKEFMRTNSEVYAEIDEKHVSVYNPLNKLFYELTKVQQSYLLFEAIIKTYVY